MNVNPNLTSITIHGYKPFGDFLAEINPLEVIVGSNGSGKSSLFEFLRFLRDSVNQGIPSEIIQGSIGQQVFHNLNEEKIIWHIEVASILHKYQIGYEGSLSGPVGDPSVVFERVMTLPPKGIKQFFYMMIENGKGYIQDPESKMRWNINQKYPDRLALNIVTNPEVEILYNLREYIPMWRFYRSFNIANDKIRRPVVIEQNPILYEDAGNLSSLLHFLVTEHQPIFDELQNILKLVIPGFKGLTAKAYGGPGEIMVFWQENGVDRLLSLADLSDGILRFLCWAVLCLQPNPPSLICIDEPDIGLHPRTLPILAGLFEKACERTQILLTTHSSYFLKQFDISRIAVMRKDDGEAKFFKPDNSKVLMENLKDFGQEEIEVMHRSDELELLAK
jgi:predicted ATPase